MYFLILSQMKALKTKIYIVILAVTLVSCSKNQQQKTRPLTLVSVDGSGWAMSTSYLRCDSV